MTKSLLPTPVSLKMKLSSYDKKSLEDQCTLLKMKFTTCIPFSLLVSKVSIVDLPTHKMKWTLLRSPHIDKKSREQLEIVTYQKILQMDLRPCKSKLQQISKFFLSGYPKWKMDSSLSISFHLQHQKRYQLVNHL
uniref:Ribosomal protein S10 n=1 Tax=Jakoba libera TaxID=143017 RepID=M4QL88_JAKLI|nr:ribosomal protein S10 [Jakoba libera]AGH24213.1 ribosomal protein S10 [Jakoba libera]